MDLVKPERINCSQCKRLVNTVKLIKVSDTLVCIPCWRIRVYTRVKHGIG